jgi:hypothetical protein
MHYENFDCTTSCAWPQILYFGHSNDIHGVFGNSVPTSLWDIHESANKCPSNYSKYGYEFVAINYLFKYSKYCQRVRSNFIFIVFCYTHLIRLSPFLKRKSHLIKFDTCWQVQNIMVVYSKIYRQSQYILYKWCYKHSQKITYKQSQ